MLCMMVGYIVKLTYLHSLQLFVSNWLAYFDDFICYFLSRVQFVGTSFHYFLCLLTVMCNGTSISD